MTWDLPALLPIQEEGVLRIFIALKNPSPWPVLNPQPLGPVASTLTTTPSRRLFNYVPQVIPENAAFKKEQFKELLAPTYIRQFA
jgi:hypothetical protein